MRSGPALPLPLLSTDRSCGKNGGRRGKEGEGEGEGGATKIDDNFNVGEREEGRKGEFWGEEGGMRTGE